MANKYLMSLYQSIFNSDFDYSAFDSRLEMQKIMYMLQELGAPVGNYGFRWYKHGPYSQELMDDMFVISDNSMNKVCFSSYVQASIEKIKNIVKVKPDCYGMPQWMECVASILYLKKYVFSSKSNENDILTELKARKPHLSNDKANYKAFDLVNTTFECE